MIIYYTYIFFKCILDILSVLKHITRIKIYIYVQKLTYLCVLRLKKYPRSFRACNRITSLVEARSFKTVLCSKNNFLVTHIYIKIATVKLLLGNIENKK